MGLHTFMIPVQIVVFTVAFLTATDHPKAQLREKAVDSYVRAELVQLQKHFENGKFAEVLDGLETLVKAPRLKSHERALIYYKIGVTQLASGDDTASVRALENSLHEKAISAPLRARVQYTLAQAFLRGSNYAGAAKVLESWLDGTTGDKAGGYYLLGFAYAQLEQFERALVYAERAVGVGHTPPEAWLQLVMTIQFETNDYQGAIGVCKKLLRLYPKPAHWVQLSLAFKAADQGKRSLAVLELAYEQGYLHTERAIRSYVQRLMTQGAPYRAATITNREMKNGNLNPSVQNYKILARAWFAARQPQKAQIYLERASKLDSSGNTLVLLAKSYADTERWQLAMSAAQEGISKGSLERAHEAYMVLGAAQHALKQIENARVSFQAAREFPASLKAAQNWLDYLAD